jgi:hypothetical protein
MRAPMFMAATLLIAGSAIAADKPGTDGTTTAWESGGKVLAVEKCDKAEDGSYDYSTCLKALRERVVALLCKRGPGSYKWSFQVGAEKSKLDQSTTCKGG